MESYEGFDEKDLKVIQIAVQKLPITGIEAPMVTNLLRKIEMEIGFLKVPKKSRPKKGDIITKQ